MLSDEHRNFKQFIWNWRQMWTFGGTTASYMLRAVYPFN